MIMTRTCRYCGIKAHRKSGIINSNYVCGDCYHIRASALLKRCRNVEKRLMVMLK